MEYKWIKRDVGVTILCDEGPIGYFAKDNSGYLIALGDVPVLVAIIIIPEKLNEDFPFLFVGRFVSDTDAPFVFIGFVGNATELDATDKENVEKFISGFIDEDSILLDRDLRYKLEDVKAGAVA
jgi:hypothetical protein